MGRGGNHAHLGYLKCAPFYCIDYVWNTVTLSYLLSLVGAMQMRIRPRKFSYAGLNNFQTNEWGSAPDTVALLAWLWAFVVFSVLNLSPESSWLN